MAKVKLTYNHIRRFTDFNEWIDYIFDNQRQS